MVVTGSGTLDEGRTGGRERIGHPVRRAPVRAYDLS